MKTGILSLVLVLGCVLAGCVTREVSRYCLYNVEHIHGGGSPVVMGTTAAQIAAESPSAPITESQAREESPLAADYAAAESALTMESATPESGVANDGVAATDKKVMRSPASQAMVGVFTRSSDVDAAAAIQALRDVSKTASDQSAPQGVAQGKAEGTKTNTPTVNDNDTVTPTVSPTITP